MYCKELTYEDFNGNQVTEKFYFNLTKAELTEMEVSTPGGMQGYIQQIVDSQDGKQLIKLFKDLVLMTYGVKSEDGKRFKKNDDIRDAFVETNAYSELFMLLATDANEATKFINGIMPNDLIAQAKKNGLLDENGNPVANANIPANTTPIS